MAAGNSTTNSRHSSPQPTTTRSRQPSPRGEQRSFTPIITDIKNNDNKQVSTKPIEEDPNAEAILQQQRDVSFV